MGSDVKEDQVEEENRKKIAMEDSTTMTIEFLRARLISERSVSRTAKQRADDLAKRVMELEEQLRNATCQRKQADEETSEDLAVLESSEASDCSEAFDMSSEQSKTNTRSSGNEEGSITSRRRNEVEGVSDSEVEASSLTGRSLSWKGCSDNPNAIEKKNGDQARAKRRSFLSTSGSSSKPWVGKSCRQIKRKETSSAEDKEGDGPSPFDAQGNGVAAEAVDTSSCLEHRPKDSKIGFENGEGRMLVEGHYADVHIRDTDASEIENETKLICWYGTEENAQTCGDRQASANERDADMKGAGENQTKLIGWYETEENDQTCTDLRTNEHKRDADTRRAIGNETRLIGWYGTEENAHGDWEEKFRENGSCTPDSSARGDQSDITEEREESKEAAEPSCAVPSQGQEAMPGTELACFSGASKPQAPLSGSIPATCFREVCSQDRQLKNMATGKENPGTSENGKQMEWLGSSSCRLTEGQSSVQNFSSLPGGGRRLQIEESPGRLEAALQHEIPNGLGGVLEALQRAKLSLKHELVGLSQTRSALRMSETPHPSIKPRHSIDTPVGCASLFRVPTDFQLEAYASTPPSFLGPCSGSRLSLTSHHPEAVIPSYNGFPASPNMDIQKPYADHYLDMGMPPPPSRRHTYPYTDLVPKIPSANVFPRHCPSIGAEMLSAERFSVYNHQIRSKIRNR